MIQAPRFECRSFDPFPLLWNAFLAPEVNVGKCDVAQVLVEELVIAMIYKGFDSGLEIAGQEVVLQQDAILQNLPPLCNFA